MTKLTDAEIKAINPSDYSDRRLIMGSGSTCAGEVLGDPRGFIAVRFDNGDEIVGLFPTFDAAADAVAGD